MLLEEGEARPRGLCRDAGPTCSRCLASRAARRPVLACILRARRERAAIERLRVLGRAARHRDPWPGRSTRPSLLRLGREGGARAGRSSTANLIERWLGPRRQRLHPAHHLTVALALAPDGPLGGSRRGADPPPLGTALVVEALAGGARRPQRSLSGPTPPAGAGATCTRWSSRTPLGPGQPGPAPACSTDRCGRGGAQETVCPESPTTRTIPTAAVLGAELADGRRPDRSRPLPPGRCSAASRGHPASPHYADLQARWAAGKTQAMCGEGPWRVLQLNAGLSRPVGIVSLETVFPAVLSLLP